MTDDVTTPDTGGQQLTLSAMNSLLKEIRLEYSEPWYDEFRMSKANADRLKDIAIKADPLSDIKPLGIECFGVKVFESNAMPDNLVFLLKDGKIVGRILLGEGHETNAS